LNLQFTGNIFEIDHHGEHVSFLTRHWLFKICAQHLQGVVNVENISPFCCAAFNTFSSLQFPIFSVLVVETSKLDMRQLSFCLIFGFVAVLNAQGEEYEGCFSSF